MEPVVLALESSCDDTAAAILVGGKVRANVVSSQLGHTHYGGVIPEMASRQHQQAVATVVAEALRQAGVGFADLTGVAYTQGPGLMGALLVGSLYAKAVASALGIPAVAVDHLQGHRLSLCLAEPPASFPYLCLTVSGGHTQLDWVMGPTESTPLGATRDDAAGEAFDKAAKLLGLPYPGGPHLDALAETGDPEQHPLPPPSVPGLDFSFSGLKTALRYYIEKQQALQPAFLETERAHLAASFRAVVVGSLLEKLRAAILQTGARAVGIAGGVSANRHLRRAFLALCDEMGVQGTLPPLAYCTDNAAMIGLVGHYLLAEGQRSDCYTVPFATHRG